MGKDSLAKKALALHKKLRGKLRVDPTTSVRNRTDLSLVYTPGVAAVSSFLARHPKEAGDYTIKNKTVAVISDGSAVLGLGNIGPYGALPVMEGKCVLFKVFAGVDAFPIVLDTQNIDEIVETGETLDVVKKELVEKCNAGPIKTAVLGINKAKCTVAPDFYIFAEEAWIVFPREER